MAPPACQPIIPKANNKVGGNMLHSISHNSFEEVGFHKKYCKTCGEINCEMPCAEECRNDAVFSLSEENMNEAKDSVQPVTPKSQKHTLSDVRRWASVVKAQKKVQHSQKQRACSKRLNEEVEIASYLHNSLPRIIPKHFENHLSFITENNKMFSCNICSTVFDSVENVENHLKTRKHEDNIIKWLKAKLPAHLHHEMEFVSFYDSNLCCKLCQCKIDMSTHQNPYETITNIIAHNTDQEHSSRKVNHSAENLAHNLLTYLVASNPEIKANAHYIEKKMNPQFRCKLCKKNLLYDEKVEVLQQNFITHLRSLSHVKNLGDVEQCKGKVSNDKNSFINSNEFNQMTAKTDIQSLISENGVEHARNDLAAICLGEHSENNRSSQISKINGSNLRKCNNPGKDEIEHREKMQINDREVLLEGAQRSSRLNELLSSIPEGKKNINFLTENDKGSVSCLICSRVVPPNIYNIQTHIKGTNHKKNEEKVLSKYKDITGTPKKEQDIEKEIFNKTKASSNKSGGGKDLVSPFSKNVGSFSFDSENVLKHLLSKGHKGNEKKFLNSYADHLQECGHDVSVFKKIPKVVRVDKCHQIEKIPSSVLNHLFSLLLEKNSLVVENAHLFVNGVDGRHSYCKPCKKLIPLSMDLNVLENNIVSHIEHVHKRNHCEEHKTDGSSPISQHTLFSNCINLSYSLNPFSLSSDAEKKSVGKEEMYPSIAEKVTLELLGHDEQELLHMLEDQEALKLEVEDVVNHIQAKEAKEKNQRPENVQTQVVEKSPEETKILQLFGKDCDNKKVTCEQLKTCKKPFPSETRHGLPVTKMSRLLNFEVEKDEEVLNRRQKQIDFGKNTEGYSRFRQVIPQSKRRVRHPVTPPKHLKCSRRMWDGLVRAWRRQLHDWDPPSTGSASLESDIQPLAS